jgi:septum formation protein
VASVPPRLVLASTSVTRSGLLRSAGLTFETQAPAVDERALQAELTSAGRTHLELAEDLAAAKAGDVSERCPGCVVIGADQLLLVGTDTFGKPGTREGVVATLRRLRGLTHRLASGVALAEDGRIVWRHTAIAELTMRDLADDEIERYASRAGESVFGSAGAYHIEGLGMTLFSSVTGDHTTILGLPMLPVLAQLRLRGHAVP